MPCSSICDWHATYGVDARNDANWTARTRRLYVVHWHEHRAVKVGVEATKGRGRITKWRRTGATLVAVWEVRDPGDVDACRSMFQAEQECLAVLRGLYEHPPHAEWVVVVGPNQYDPGRADGATETFTAEVDDVLRRVDDVVARFPALIRRRVH